MTIAERIHKANQEIAQHEFKKDKWVGKWTFITDGKGKKTKVPDQNSNGYWVISITQILDVVRAAHAKNGIVCFFEGPFYDAQNFEGVATVPYMDGRRVVANGHYDVTIMGEGPEDVIKKRIQCRAFDSEGNDKLDNKLLTNAMRSLYRSIYSIDGDDTKDSEEENIAVQGAEPARTDRFFSNKKEQKTESNKDRAKRILPKLIEWAEKNEGNPTLDTLRNFYGRDIEGWDDKTIIDGWATLVEKEGAE